MLSSINPMKTEKKESAKQIFICLADSRQKSDMLKYQLSTFLQYA
jgi:hypothetical protein